MTSLNFPKEKSGATPTTSVYEENILSNIERKYLFSDKNVSDFYKLLQNL